MVPMRCKTLESVEDWAGRIRKKSIGCQKKLIKKIDKELKKARVQELQEEEAEEKRVQEGFDK